MTDPIPSEAPVTDGKWLTIEPEVAAGWLVRSALPAFADAQEPAVSR